MSSGGEFTKRSGDVCEQGGNVAVALTKWQDSEVKSVEQLRRRCYMFMKWLQKVRWRGAVIKWVTSHDYKWSVKVQSTTR